MVTQPKWQYTANVYDIDGHHLDRPAEWIGDLIDDHIGDRKQLVDRMFCFFWSWIYDGRWHINKTTKLGCRTPPFTTA